MEYLPDIFYETDKMSKNQFKNLMKEAYTLCTNWWVDDRPEWKRRRIDMPFYKAMNIFHKTTRKYLHITLIHRRGFQHMDYLEIGFCTLNTTGKNGDIFLWIIVDTKHKEYLLNKYYFKQPQQL